MIDDKMRAELIEKAILARENAYTPYSHFMVGAALLTKSGKIYTGCNIECSTYSPTVCGERTAFFKAVSEGERDFVAIGIVGGFEGEPLRDEAYPCGVCRQVMSEFCGKDFEIILGSSKDNFHVHTLEEILPYSFVLDEHKL